MPSGLGLVLFALWVASMGLGIFDVVDAAVRRSDAFVAAGKATKPDRKSVV